MSQKKSKKQTKAKQAKRVRKQTTEQIKEPSQKEKTQAFEIALEMIRARRVGDLHSFLDLIGKEGEKSGKVPKISHEVEYVVMQKTIQFIKDEFQKQTKKKPASIEVHHLVMVMLEFLIGKAIARGILRKGGVDEARRIVQILGMVGSLQSLREVVSGIKEASAGAKVEIHMEEIDKDGRPNEEADVDRKAEGEPENPGARVAQLLGSVGIVVDGVLPGEPVDSVRADGGSSDLPGSGLRSKE